MGPIATIDDPAVIQRILVHLALPGARDGPAPACAVSPPRRSAHAPLRAPVVTSPASGPSGRLPVTGVAP